MRKTLTKEVIQVNLKDIGFELNYFYRDKKSKLYVNSTCKNGHTDTLRYDTIIKTKKCKYCEDNKFTYDYVKKYLSDRHQILLSDIYVNARTKLKVQCEFGHVYYPTFDSFKNKRSRCPKCKCLSKYSYEEVKIYIEENGYKLISDEYLNNKTNIRVVCDKGHEYPVSFDNFKNKSKRCPICNGGVSLEYEIIKRRIEQKGFVLLSVNYTNAKTKLQLKCCKGHYFENTLDNLRHKELYCPKCNRYKGENEIYNFLHKHTIKHDEQHRFDDCKFKYALPFDFYLPDYNLCIEYDGIQHYEIIDFFGGLDGFIDTKIRDTIKAIYCKRKGIKLLRIPYWDIDNVENIMRETLKINPK